MAEIFFADRLFDSVEDAYTDKLVGDFIAQVRDMLRQQKEPTRNASDQTTEF